MNIDELLGRHTVPDSSGGDINNIEDLGGYGLLRSSRDRCFAIELRKKDDTVLAINYALIEHYIYSPSDGITLRATGREIHIRGKNLNDNSVKAPSLFSAMVRQRVSWVSEQSRLTGFTSDIATRIMSITW